MRAPRPAVSEPPGPSDRVPSRAESSERAQARLDGIRAEERHMDAILRAKQRDLQLVSDQLQSLETGRAAEEDRARRDYQQHQCDVLANQAEADRRDSKHQARLLQFQREEKELHAQLDREKAEDERASSPPRFQRNNPSQRYRLQSARPSAGEPSAGVASALAPSPYQSAAEASSDARLCLCEQLRAFSRSSTSIDAVPSVPLQRVQSLWPIDRGPSTEVPRSDFSPTTASAARFDRRENSSFEPYQRRDSCHQQLKQAGRDWAFGPQRPPVSTIMLSCQFTPRHAPRRVLRQPQCPRPINRRQTSAATLGSRQAKPITLPRLPTNNRVSFTILISPLTLNTLETWTLRTPLGLRPRPHQGHRAEAPRALGPPSNCTRASTRCTLNSTISSRLMTSCRPWRPSPLMEMIARSATINCT